MTTRLAIFVSFSGDGGVERVIVNLCQGFLDQGFAVDLLLVKARGPHFAKLPVGVNIIRLGSSHTALCLLPLVRYLRRERPPALLTAKNRGNRIALLAGALAGGSTRIVVRMDTHLSKALEHSNLLRRLAYYLPMRWLYPRAHAIVAVSQGVADDTARITGLPAERITVIHNPVIAHDLFEQAAEPVVHPFLSPKTTPVLVGSGRLTRQKDFPTLLRAFAIVHARRPCRLLILGDGEPGARAALEALALDLGIQEALSLPGFRPNPYAYLARCDLFVLSSIWEGSPTVLTEALALGIPVVATDCPSGPREITQNGRYGHLVPMEDPEALAAAITVALDTPPDRLALQQAVADYHTIASTAGHLRALGLAP
ncbi:glycosyl transferase [Thiocapsa imhoffii]|uniref:Glycosyl transferase n=1 Tax=Thiocapsa imhoffii TaxID=382777 RepID=A0A9X0WJZ3_9GAMM|nr:glycosyltransferase [Thiocapsa imhoffii]MBK1645943.1 glycosyl transferase [Thiocapsa imhoffii]